MVPALTDNAQKVLRARYLRRDRTGEVIETPGELFRRVAHSVAQAEAQWGGSATAAAWEETFFEALTDLDFLPNSPTLMNAGTPLRQLSACFVLPVEDRMEGIFDALKLMALVQQSGGGTGFSFSRLRLRGDVVASTGGGASAPFPSCASSTVRRKTSAWGAGAAGPTWACSASIIPTFGTSSPPRPTATVSRISTCPWGVSDAFMEAPAAQQPFPLRHPRTGRQTETVPAAELLADIAGAAWQTGDPGLLFLDAINRANPTPALGEIEASNPCGEVPLLPYESCNLGSVNLSHMARRAGNDYAIDWEKLGRLVRLGIRFLDDVIEVGRWPTPQIAAMTRGNRKVGLGVMGFAELLILVGIPYAGDRAADLAAEVSKFLAAEALAASRQLAQERGVFPNWDRSVYRSQDLRVRNATRTSIAPTGTLSILAGTSASIEPLFALAYRREGALGGATLEELNPLFLRHARERGFYSERLVQELLARGSLSDIAGVPPEDVAATYRRAWELALKGITVYRYGSKDQQVLLLGGSETPEEREHFARCDPHACKL
jgi:ribonucleoside-diphosphate reductase alpha chain